MSLNILNTLVSGIIRATHINDIVNALVNQFVGRNSSGQPESGQDLGTALYPWGSMYADRAIIAGSLLDISSLTTPRNKIVSGRTRSASSEQADFLRADGTTNKLTVLATSVNLEVYINGDRVLATLDIEKTSLQLGPAANNTCLIDQSGISSNTIEFTFIWGEEDYGIPIDAIGSNIVARQGMMVALQNTTGAKEEIMFGFLRTAAAVGEYGPGLFRGYFFDDNGDPLGREAALDNETLTLLELGWVFIQNNGTTVDVSYLTPLFGGTTPTTDIQGGALATGQYWLDSDDDEWKYYDGASFVSSNRTIIGVCVMNDTACIATRSFDFSRLFSAENNIELLKKSNSEISVWDNTNYINVFGRPLSFQNASIIFDITQDLEEGSEAASTQYYVYLTENGDKKISTKKPYTRGDLRGLYHPHNVWRAIGEFYNNASSNIQDVLSYTNKENTFEINTKKIWKEIGSWDMDASATSSIINFPRMYTQINIIDIKVIIISDGGTLTYPLTISDPPGDFEPQGAIDILGFTATTGHRIQLYRKAIGLFDVAGFSNPNVNRGYVILEYRK